MNAAANPLTNMEEKVSAVRKRRKQFCWFIVREYSVADVPEILRS
jgi:hypothetical protein